MSGAGRGGLLERHPADFRDTVANPRAVSKSAQTNVQFLRAEAGRADFGKVLQLKQDFAVGPLAIAMDHRLAFFVIFCQCPGADGLDISRSKSRTAVSIKHVASSRLIKHRPHLQSLTEFPAATVQHGATPTQLRWLTLISRALSEVVKRLLAGNFQPNRFKSSIHICI